MERTGALSMLVLMVYHISADLPHNNCGEPPPCANTYRTFPDNNTVEYRCLDTYLLSSGDLVRNCVNGKYTGACPVCALDCGPPLNTSYASINSTGTKEGDKVTYTCPDGFLVSSTDTECSATSGHWLAGDRCFANSSLDVAAFTAVQTSTASLADIHNTTTKHLSLPLNTTFSAAYAVDVTKLGVSLANGDCSSTALEQRPHMNISLGDYYDVFQVAVTLPDDDFAFSLPNLEVKRQSNLQHRWHTCMKHSAIIPAGSRFVATCTSQRYPGYARFLQLEVDFGDRPGMLQICQIEVYARPITAVDCGQPPQLPLAVITSHPSVTHFNHAAEKITYKCIEGYNIKDGRERSYCNVHGYWTGSIKCTADDNLAHEKPVSLTSNNSLAISPLTDGNTSSCSVAHNLKEITFVIDLGSDVEVGDVSVSLHATKNEYPIVRGTVWRDGYPESPCTPDQVYTNHHETANVKCLHFPVGRYVRVNINFNAIVRFEVCDVRVHGRPYTEALECYRQSRQTDYKGHLNLTVAGILCQRWDSQKPHPHSQTDISKFPDDNFADAANYCRNPDGKVGPWCYTTDEDVEWQYCALRYCDYMCMQDDKGSSYKGAVTKTSSGTSCVAWSSPSLPFKKKSHFSNFWQGMTNCRNPLLSQSRPWCYTSAVNASQYGLCDIPTSCPTTSEMTRSRWVAYAGQTFDDLLPSTECLVWNRLYTDGNFSATSTNAFSPRLYRNTFTANAVCHAGKVFNTYLQCFNITGSGTVWKAGVLECVHCGSAPSVENAAVQVSSSLLNGTATYACVTGYGQASGSNKITCLKTGEWQVPDMFCEVDCGTPPDLDHADVNVSSTLAGDTANYTCHDGYAHESVSSEVICLDTGKWDIADMKCEVNCGDPPSKNRTEVSDTDGFVNETAEYTCKPGYAHKSGSAIITCLDTSIWEDPGIYCEVDCGTPPPLNNADVDVNSTLLGQTANYICQDGYAHLSGSTEVTCLDTGHWDTPELKCEVNCGDPPSTNRTEISPTDGFVNDTVEYTCKPGYAHVSGSGVITCLDTGTWEDPGIYCEVDCDTPPSLNHTNVDVNSTVLGQTANYSCQEGYAHLSGSTEVICLDTGKWDVSDFKCEVNCGNSPSTNRTEISPTDGFVNETAEYTCKPGYAHVSGSAVITCLDSGTWEQPGIYCEVDCSSPPVVANTVVITDNTTLNSTAVYRCAPGSVHVNGSTNITCLGTGFWETPSMQCVADCGLPPEFNNTKMAYNNTLVNSTAEYTCVDGTAHVSGSTQVTCLSDGNWTTTDVLCLDACGEPPQVNNTNVIYNSTLTNSTAEYTCVYGTVLGSAQITCQSDGNWTKSEITCLEEPLPSTTSSSTPTPIPVDKYGRTRTEKCTCRCINAAPKKQEDIVAEISKKLTLETKTLTSSIMKKESLPDKRKSSHGIAYVALAVIGVVFGVVLFSDIYFVINEIIGRPRIYSTR